MLNIAYKGKLKNENQLICDDKLPQKAVQFNEGEDIKDLFIVNDKNNSTMESTRNGAEN